MEKAQYAIMRFAKYKGLKSAISRPITSAQRKSTPVIPMWIPAEASTTSIWSNRPASTGPSQRGKLPLPDAYPERQYPYDRDAVHSQPGVFKGKKRAEIRVFFEEALHFFGTASVQRDNYIRRGAYGRENAPYAPLFCPFDGGWQAQRQRHHGQ